MNDAATMLKELGCDEASVNGYRNEIWIEYDHTNLVLHFTEEDEDDESIGTGYYDLDEVDLSLMTIDSVCLSDGCDAREEAYPDNDVSYSATMYAIVRKIQQQYPDAINHYGVDEYFLDDCDKLGCPENVEYGYRIYLRREFWEDGSNLKLLVESIRPGSVYFRDCYEGYVGTEINDSHKFDFLGTNTKVRRLGYLSMLLSLFEDSPRIAKKNLCRMLEQKAAENQEAIEHYKNKKGVILPSRTGVSANPYIELALETDVIHEMTGHYELGKMGRVFLEARKVTHIRQENPFELTAFEKVFWLERLLEQDFVYLFTLMEYSFVSKTASYSELRKKFDALIVEKLEAIYGEVEDNMRRIAIRATIQRIKSWKKSEIYLEHILMPRINWLYDLGLLELKRDLSFELTKEGKLLFLHLAEWRDLRPSVVCNAACYLDAFYMHVANDIFMEGQGDCASDMARALEDALTYSFDHFKTMAPNRVTFSVFAAFAKYTLLQNKQKVVETADIKNNYLPSVVDKYVFMYQRYYNDGFIQKK